MKETKFTPGPHYVGAMNDALFILTERPSPSGTDAPPDTPHPHQKILAKVDSAEASFEENLANANLYAAATDMYDFIATLENDNGNIPPWIWGKRGKLLAKARGEK